MRPQKVGGSALARSMGIVAFLDKTGPCWDSVGFGKQVRRLVHEFILLRSETPLGRLNRCHCRRPRVWFFAGAWRSRRSYSVSRSPCLWLHPQPIRSRGRCSTSSWAKTPDPLQFLKHGLRRRLVSQHVSYKTEETYRDQVNGHIVPVIGWLELSKLSSDKHYRDTLDLAARAAERLYPDDRSRSSRPSVICLLVEPRRQAPNLTP